MKFISHICAFSRGALNVRSTRSHPTLAPRPQIWLMNFTGFCTVAGEDELNGKWEDWGTEADVFCLPENNWSREYDLTCNILRASRKLLPSLPNPHNHYFIQTKSRQRQPAKKTDILYLWPRSKV